MAGWSSFGSVAALACAQHRAPPPPPPPPPGIPPPGEPIVYTYDVDWETSDITWPSRWDAYLFRPGGSQVHWLSMLNSLVVVVRRGAGVRWG